MCGAVVPFLLSATGVICEHIPRTGTMWFVYCGRREDVYAFVAKTTCFARIIPRGVVNSHFHILSLVRRIVWAGV